MEFVSGHALNVGGRKTGMGFVIIWVVLSFRRLFEGKYLQDLGLRWCPIGPDVMEGFRYGPQAIKPCPPELAGLAT